MTPGLKAVTESVKGTPSTPLPPVGCERNTGNPEGTPLITVF